MKIVASNNITVSNVSDGTITHTAWSYSADGTDGFTTVYPNLNLLTDTKDFINKDLLGNNQKTSIVAPNSTVLKDGNDTYLKFISTADNQYWLDCYLVSDWSTTPPPDFINANILPNSKYTFSFLAKGTGEHTVTAYDKWTTPSNIVINFTLTNEWKYYSFTVTSSATIPVKNVEFFLRSITTGSEINLKKPKVEEGSIATPYMQSSSEVTTADWPKYIGQYTDFMQADSTNPSDYTWGPMRGNDGISPTVKINPDTSLTIVDAKGTSKTPVLKGADGLPGKDGVGIKTTVITYAISTSGTTAPTTGWTSSVPSLVKGQYLWTKTVWTYTDNSSETGYSVTYISKDGTDGDDGLPGKDGTGIKTTTITYAGSTNGTTAPSSGWTSTVPTVAAGSYLWTKTVWAYTDNTSETGYSVARMGLKGDKGDPGIKGTDGTSGIIVSSVAPDSPQTGQLWQDTSTSPQLVKKWTGTSWVIWELYVENMNVNNLSALSTNLGDINGGTLKLMDDDMILNGQPKMYGIYQSKLGLISSGPTFETTGMLSNTQMGVASLNKGELRFMVTDYTENLKNVREAGMSDPNNAFIKFNSYDNGKDVMLIGSSGDIVFKGITSQDTPWVTLSSGVKYKYMFSRMYISVDVVGNGGSFMQFGTLPQNLRPVTDQFMIIANQGAGTADDRHIMVRASDGAVILWTPKSGITYRGEVSYTL